MYSNNKNLELEITDANNLIQSLSDNIVIKREEEIRIKLIFSSHKPMKTISLLTM